MSIDNTRWDLANFLPESGYTTSVEDVVVRITDAQVLIHHHHLPDRSMVVRDPIHHVLRVTLKDASVWVIDLTGAQYGQHRSVLSFDDYKRDYVAEVVTSRPFYDRRQLYQDYHVQRYPMPQGASQDSVLSHWQNLIYQEDELAEWEFHQIAVNDLLKAKDEEYQKLRSELVNHLATAAREYVKRERKDPSSTAKPIMVTNFGHDKLTEEERDRMERKKLRKFAAMGPVKRAHYQALLASDEKDYMLVL